MTTISPERAAFCASLPWTLDIAWDGLTGLHKLDDDRRVTLTLTTHGHGGEYQGFDVAIISKTHGPIVTQRFMFDDHLINDRENRLDDRLTFKPKSPPERPYDVPAYPIGENDCFKVIAHVGWRWYIAVPAHPEMFTDAVEGWILAWR